MMFTSLLCYAGFLQTPVIPVLAESARVTAPAIKEMSGIVKSARYPDTFWVHNDSGDKSRIFAIHADGTFIGQKPKTGDYEGVEIGNAANADWEDIARIGDTLYISDLGNNGNTRRDLGIYAVTEPNPMAYPAARSFAWYPVAYPDQKDFPPTGTYDFDAEALFAVRGTLFVITKHRAVGGKLPVGAASLYRLKRPQANQVNMLKKVDQKADLGGWVTAADASPDGKLVAVLTQAPVQSVWLFDATAPQDKFLSKPVKRFVFSGGDQCEAVCFDGPDSLLITNEQRQIFRVSLSRFTSVR